MDWIKNGQGKLTTGQNETEAEIKKYLRIVQKRKWLIALISLISSFGWMAFMILFQTRQSYTAEAILAFQDPKQMSAVEERGDWQTASGLIKTTALLKQVIETLKLNLSVVTEDMTKSDLFDYLDVTPLSVAGLYTVTKNHNEYNLSYTNEESEIKDSLLTTFLAQDTVRINDIAFQLNQIFLRNSSFDKLEFEVKLIDDTIEKLRDNLDYRTSRKSTLLTISASSKSPIGAANIANTVAEKFVELNQKMRRHKSEQVLEILENELQLAKKELDEANVRLREFTEQYPWVQMKSSGYELTTTLEEDKVRVKTRMEEVKDLLYQLDQTTGMENKISVSRELLTYLTLENVPLSSAFRTEFVGLTSDRDILLESYAPTHPFVVENDEKLAVVIQKIKNASLNLTKSLTGDIKTLSSKISSESYKEKLLPQKVLEFRILSEDQGIKNDLYNKIFSKYNSAKIDNQVEVSEVFILDRALPPPLVDNFTSFLQKLFLGLFLSLGVGIGLAIVVEFFDKTVANVEDLQGKIKLPVIGSIPVINIAEEGSKSPEYLRGKRDPRLITIDYSPRYESETYRDIRTKIMLRRKKEGHSAVMITSLNANEGKSLTSSNIVVTLAQQRISTVLVDADLRRGVLHNTFGNKKKPGLSDFLGSKATIDYNNVNKLVQNTFIPNLGLISSGSAIPNPTEMLGSERMIKLLHLLKSHFDMVVFDTPPINTITDAMVLSSQVDIILLVVRAGSTNIERLYQKLQEYPEFQERIIGLVLNMVKPNMMKDQYQYPYYNY